jgi:hypothetical protein
MDYKNINRRLLSLKERDPGFKEFGASTHQYQLNAPLSLADVEAFEQTYQAQLPADYREFLLDAGNGGAGPFYGLRSLQDSLIDFKLKEKPLIAISKPFPYTEKWNAAWIEEFDWEGEHPEDDLVNAYMDVAHIQGCLEICHFGHGCTFLLVISGSERGNIWFDGRADYGGLEPELNGRGSRISFSEWYMQWLEEKLQQV